MRMFRAGEARKENDVKQKAILLVVLMMCFSPASFGQVSKKYSNNGVVFEYLPDWELTDQLGADSQQIHSPIKRRMLRSS